MEKKKDILIVVDMQNDFVDGSLGTPEAVSIVAAVAEKICAFRGEILYTMDTHGEDYLATQEGRNLPVKHCIEGTEGWMLAPAVRHALAEKGALGGEHCVCKCTFGSKDLPGRILAATDGEQPVSFTLIGLCTDICVISNAMLLKAFFPEVPMYVDPLCCAGVTPERHEEALASMQCCQISVQPHPGV